MTPIPKVLDLYHGDTVSSFEEISTAGIRGIIHKATEGANFDDSSYAPRRSEALDAGLLWGAYHFLRPGDVVGQAHRFLDVAAPTEATLLAADHEDPRVKLSDLIAFMQEIEAAGHKPVLYSGFLIKEQILKATADQKSYLIGRELWLAQYSKAPKVPLPWATPWLWQYSEKGKVSGISGNVDVNAFDGTDDDLNKQWATV